MTVRRRLAAVVLCALALGTAPSDSRAQGAEVGGFVYVVRPGKTPLKAKASLSAPSAGAVGFGQKLAVKQREAAGWLLVEVPGESTTGWISVRVVGENRPGLDSQAVGAAAAKVAVNETASTAGAIRGLDGRTAGYAAVKQIPPEALSQLGRLEAHTEKQFRDPHSVGRDGVWRYPDVTVEGRYEAARTFAREEGLPVPLRPK